MSPSKFLKHWSFLLIGWVFLFVVLSPFSSFATDLTVADSISPGDDRLMPFGSLETAAGATAEQTVTITNTSGSVKPLFAIRISGEGAEAFTLDLNGGGNPCLSTTPTLAPNENCTVAIRFDPEFTGLHTAFLNLSLEEEKIAFHDATTNGISLYGVSSQVVSVLTTQISGSAEDFLSWSPDGAQLVFHRDDASGLPAVYRMPSSGGSETLISDDASGGRATMPDWSPDGNKIIMRETSLGGLFLFDLSIPQFEQVLGVSSVSGEAHSPDWSSDSQKIVFRQAIPGGLPIQDPNNIFTKSTDVADQNLIVSGGFTPSWSPDGQQIAFMEDMTNGISRADAGGGLNTTVQLTVSPSGSEDSQPSWSPDGDKIVFRRAAGSGDTDNGILFIIDSETGVLLDTILGTTGRTPAWSPASLSNITLTGTGLAAAGANNAPTAPVLVSPQNGETGLGRNVEFKWLPSSDPDGDTLTYELLLCKTADYDPLDLSSCPAPTVVSKTLGEQTAFYAVSSGLFFIGVVFMSAQSGRKKRLFCFQSLVLITGILILSACKSGGGGSSSSTPPSIDGEGTELTSTVGGLLAETSYNWKITAKDGNGGVTDSLVRTFSTAP